MGGCSGHDGPYLHYEDAVDRISQGVVLVDCGWHFRVVDGQCILAVLAVSLRAKKLKQSQEALLTAGISSDASSAATVMIYSQVIWALILDRIIWHVDLNVWVLIGVGSVVCSLILVSLAKEATTKRQKDGVQHETVTFFTDADTGDIDLDSLYASDLLHPSEPA
jgi:hypothetical protein